MTGIKPLGWDEKPRFGGSKVTGDQGGVHLTAKTVVGKYNIHSFDGDRTFFVFTPNEGDKLKATTLAEARALAQANFDARIMSAFVEEPCV